MGSILALLDIKTNGQLLTQWLATDHEVWHEGDLAAIDEPYDLILVDEQALGQFWSDIQARKQAEHPVLLPVLLVTPHQNVEVAYHHLWKHVDDLVASPVEKNELLARVEVLRRSRQLSLNLHQRNQELKTFTNVLAHDLRSPLHTVINTVQILQEDYPHQLDARGLGHLERMEAAAWRMQELLAALMRFIRLGHEAIEMQPISLAPIIEQCARDLPTELRSHDPCITTSDPLPRIHADPVLLKIILTNLLSNAIKYVAPEVQPEVTIAARAMPCGWRIEVQDNGIGIAPEEQQRIFAPFVRMDKRTQPGTGLGLAIVQKAIELMGGQVGVQSRLGAGSMFWVELCSVDQE